MAGERPEKTTSTVNCPACDVPVPLRSLGQATTIGCAACGTIFDGSDPRLRIVSRFQRKKKRSPIPLGVRGTLFGVKYEVIGHLVKSDQSGIYHWDELLLMNPYQGFAWLAHFDNEWTFLQTTKSAPLVEGQHAWFEKQKYKLYLRDRPKVTFVVGEFYWEVAVGDTARTTDYIAPPYIISEERAAGETVWSFGRYVYPKELTQAFGVELPGVPPWTVNSVTPNRWKERAMYSGIVAGIMLVLLWLTHSMLDRRHPKLLFERPYVYDPRSPTSAKVTTEDFLVAGKPGARTNVRLEANAEVNNSWVSFDLTLLDLDRSDDDESSLEVSFYHGVDSDGAWREGGTNEHVFFSDVEPGRYNIIADVSAGDTNVPIPYTLRAMQDIPTGQNLVACILLLVSVPLACAIGAGFFENARWEKSDV